MTVTGRRVERLELAGTERAQYFAPVVFCVYLSLICIAMIVTALFLTNRGETLAVIAASSFGLCLALGLGSVVLVVQRRELRFLVVTTARTNDENFALVKRHSLLQGWTITLEEAGSQLITRTPDSMLNKGEIVAVRFIGDKVLVASICNPAVGFSLLGSSRCKLNRETVRSALQEGAASFVRSEPAV